jgi:glycosyltransferase involved in cell wall biosynthesis
MLNLSKLLKDRGHNVKIVYGFEEFGGEQVPKLDGIELENIFYSKKTIRIGKHVDRFLWKPIAIVLRKLSLLNVYSQLSIREILFSRIIRKALFKNKFDELIAVDILPLYWIQQIHGSCHFVSLEVGDCTQLVRFLEISKIKSILIQSPERLERLLGQSEVKRFFVQNAPNFVEPTKRTKASVKLIYNGTAWAPFGTLDIIEFVKRYPEYKIHFKGSIEANLWELVRSRYKALIDTGVLSFSETYINDNTLREYLADYSIGFCFYDFKDPFISQRRFNYETAPSGKVFMYLSVGMPVVATRIQGFMFFEEKQAGILVDDHKPETIKKAVEAILSNYENFSNNALEIGKSFSFDRSAKPFIDFISE